jgi:dTDP-4-dehydrorhamnose reductase
MKILLLGANGQLGTDLVKTNPGFDLVPAVRADADLTEAAAVLALAEKHRPAWVLNTVAFNRTEDCEVKPDLAFAVNAFGARGAARAAAAVGARCLHVSTDFVFDGAKRTPYVESDPARPPSVYALSKFGGECFVLAESADNLVVRGAGLFGAAGSSGKGGNFIESVIAKAQKGEPVAVVDDIVMSPTYTRDMAARLWELIDRAAPGGVHHAVNDGACSWFEFAREAFRLLGLPEPRPVPAASYPTRMKRSPYTVLASERLASMGLKPLRPWKEALRAYLVEKGRLS